MREVAGRGEGAFDGFLAIFEQGVQVVNQGLDFVGVHAFDPALFAPANSHQPFPQLPEGHQTPAHPKDARRHENQTKNDGSD